MLRVCALLLEEPASVDDQLLVLAQSDLITRLLMSTSEVDVIEAPSTLGPWRPTEGDR